MAFKVIVEDIGRGYYPKVTILSRGQIGFTLGAIKVCKIEPQSNILILFDEETKKMGFKFNVDASTAGAKRLKTYASGALISAKGILELCKIDFTITKSYDLVYDKTNKIYVIDLNKGVPKLKAIKKSK